MPLTTATVSERIPGEKMNHCLHGALRWLLLAWLVSVAPATMAQAQGDTVRLRVVGGLGGLNQYLRHEEPFWSRVLPQLSGGRYSAEVVPFDRAGIRGQEMLSLIQLGVIPFGTVLVSQDSGRDMEIAAPDLAGLNPDMATLRRSVAAFRPWLTRMLRERRGVELLAMYVYPAQAVFCSKPLKGLSDLAGRRVRTSSPSQSDLVQSLGATAVPTGFADIVPNLRAGNIECAITGTMSGNTIGLHEMTSHLHGMALNWGVSIFAANGAAWAALPAELKAMLQRQLPQLEAAVWAESDRETLAGIACNTGASACAGGRAGHMTEVKVSPDDERRRREIFARVVLPRWVERCGAGCAEVWNATLADSSGIRASQAPPPPVTAATPPR
ncbi:TRAP-type C4-dicarboxylate transport system, periplasmic component [Burkholderiales bacterium JOSHI_001]|nr:TRAP-type C4-dicarboxylate transport system, periplasmic component [Burkholderiales bacterium JOSHI_001]